MEAIGNHTVKQHHSHLKSPDENSHHGTLSSTSILIIVLCGISAAVLLAIVIIIVMLRRLKKRDAKSSSGLKDTGSINPERHNSSRFINQHTVIDFNSSPDVKVRCLQGGNLVPTIKSLTQFHGVQVFTYKELELATNKFNEANVIGNGGHGVVYRGVLSDGTVVAIKMLHREGKHGERAFRMEVDLLSRVHSPYLVELVGYCADSHHRLLIFQYMPNGTLQQYLHHQKQHKPLDWRTRLRIALDCACALEFLHEHASPGVIHRDFKCSNVLLDHNLRARVSDLGLAKMGSDKINGHMSTSVLGTTGYLAPEYASTGKLTTKSDVYGYGVVLLQLLTGRIPVDTNRPSGEHVLVSWALPRLTNRVKVAGMVDPALGGRYSKKDLIQVAAIAAMCVQPEADYRPLMTDVVQSLIPLVKSFSSPSYRFHTQMSSPR